MLLSVVPVAFAVETGQIFTLTFDNKAPHAGDKITATINLDQTPSDYYKVTTTLKYNKDVLTYESYTCSWEGMTCTVTEKNSGDDKSKVFFKIDSNKGKDTDILNKIQTRQTGAFATVTFKVNDSCKVGQAINYTFLGSFYDAKAMAAINNARVTGSLAVTEQGGSIITVPKTETGYSVSMGADQQLVSGQRVRIPVTVASSEKKITGFNAYDMTFTYDPAALTLNTKTGAAANLTVEDNNGTVRVRRYGDAVPLGEALALEFTAKATATSAVTLTNAKFDLDANSINFDAPEATISDADTVVNANNFTVTLPDAFTSDETRLVPKGGSFTFKPVDSHYTYTFTVKMGDSATEGLTFGANDTYTIENISGNVEVTYTGKTPKQYDVKYKIDEDVEQDVTKGPETVTYLNDYSFVVTPRAGYSYRVIYSVDNGDPFVHTVIAVPTANDDGTLTYTIPGKEIVGGVEIWIDPNTESGIPVVFTGNGVEDAASGNASSMGKNMPYYFTLNQRESCDYTVTAYYQPLATPTASKRPATVRSLGNGKYVVEAVNYNDYLYVYARSWNLVVKVEKVSHSAEEVTVSKYLELNDKTMMLITVKGTPEGGKAFTYDCNTMYKVNAYGTDQYAWLVIVDKGQTLTQEEAAAKVAISAADNVVTITLGFDVNMTGKVDVNDAQLVYDMYNGKYSDFTKVSVEKFLRADVNATKVVDHTDAVAIVNQFK
ncbi:cohesin domain-containing protein [Vescimonas fastidiosa]|uniref:cohesin domain-containing protein n=1 Tax=Vescimonas fastidiosa TaxID=2714353 RepID=UPI0022A87C62|nr:cohesin domain-containing protein [Vescimonas fastidiosa]